MASDRSTWARAAAHQSWANTADRSARTAPARAAALDRFERQVDPDGTLDPRERAVRAESARKAHMARMSALAVKARREKAKARKVLVACPCGRPTTGERCSECTERGAA